MRCHIIICSEVNMNKFSRFMIMFRLDIINTQKIVCRRVGTKYMIICSSFYQHFLWYCFNTYHLSLNFGWFLLFPLNKKFIFFLFPFSFKYCITALLQPHSHKFVLTCLFSILFKINLQIKFDSNTYYVSLQQFFKIKI